MVYLNIIHAQPVGFLGFCFYYCAFRRRDGLPFGKWRTCVYMAKFFDWHCRLLVNSHHSISSYKKNKRSVFHPSIDDDTHFRVKQLVLYSSYKWCVLLDTCPLDKKSGIISGCIDITSNNYRSDFRHLWNYCLGLAMDI